MGDVEIPGEWLDGEARPLVEEALASGGTPQDAMLATAANGVNKVWECYVAGISPTNEAAKFEATIEMDADGKPVVKWNPPLTEEEAAKRTYRTLGKKTLDPVVEWTDVTDESDLDAAGWRLPFRRRSAASLRLVRGGHASRSPVAWGLGFALGIFFKVKVEMR